MGSWTTGALTAAGLAGDLATTIGGLVLGAQTADNNKNLANLQAQALQLNLQLQQEGLAISKEWNDPAARYSKALAAGYDPISARQVAGAGFTHFQGGVAMHPIKNQTALDLRYSNMAQQGLAAGKAFTHGVPRRLRPDQYYTSAWVTAQGQDAFTSDWVAPSNSWHGTNPMYAQSMPRNWGSESTRSTLPSIPSWATLSTPPGTIRAIPGSAVRSRPRVSPHTFQNFNQSSQI